MKVYGVRKTESTLLRSLHRPPRRITAHPAAEKIALPAQRSLRLLPFSPIRKWRLEKKQPVNELPLQLAIGLFIGRDPQSVNRIFSRQKSPRRVLSTLHIRFL